jgi:predicted transcriptional regulator of viral defense system
MIAMPKTGGGIDHIADCLTAYLRSPENDARLLIRYAAEYGNGAIFKRLGFLAETRIQNEELAAACLARLTQGYAKLDPTLPCPQLVTPWRLWVPERWKRGAP